VKLAIAIPTYNEAANIRTLLESIHDQLSRISNVQTIVYVIDDNSPDGTADLVTSIAKTCKTKNFAITVIGRSVKDGLGGAYIFGFNEILKTKADYIIQMDGDLSHDPKYLPSFVKAAGQHDLIIGSRYITGGATPDWSLFRKFLSRGGNMYARLILGNKVADYTGGYNMFSAKLLRQADISTIRSTGYGFLIDLKFRALQHAQSVHQVPIVFHDRHHGKSKLPKSTIITNLFLVPLIKLRTRAS
jgi:dolichol-phosphate mannosyltransferase